MSSNLEIILCSVFVFSPILKRNYFFSSHIALGMTTKVQHSAASRNNSRICLVILPRPNLVENYYVMEKRLCCICKWEYFWEKRAFLRQTFPDLWIIWVLKAAVAIASRKEVSHAHVCEFSHMNKSTIKAKKLFELPNPNFYVSLEFSVWRERKSCSLPHCFLLLILPP